MNSEPRWAFIGTSGWVASRFAPTVLTAGHRIAGAFGSSPEGSRGFAERFGCRAYASIEDLLGDDEVDVVWIASPTPLHEEHVRQAADAGKRMLIEKPLTDRAASAHALEDLLAARGARAVMGYHHRFNPGIRKLHAILTAGELGELCSVTLAHGTPAPGNPTSWRSEPGGAGWSIADIGTHLLDTARYLLGDLGLVAARLSTPGLHLDVDDLSVLMLERGAATVTVRASTGMASPPSVIEIAGTRGWARLHAFWNGTGALERSDGTTHDVTPADPYLEEVRAVGDWVRGATWTGASIADGVEVTRLVDAARAMSARESDGVVLRG